MVAIKFFVNRSTQHRDTDLRVHAPAAITFDPELVPGGLNTRPARWLPIELRVKSEVTGRDVHIAHEVARLTRTLRAIHGRIFPLD